MDDLFPARIQEVSPGSPAERAGVRAGDSLLSVAGRPVPDILAYRYLLSGGPTELVVEPQGGGPPLRFAVGWEDPGLEFGDVLFDGIHKCANKCDFCYVHQMPRGFRKSLYLMDDDYRLSFLYGSFVTLTNLAEEDIQRILRERLSPLYVSVHAADAESRRDLMKYWRLKVKDPAATDILQMLDRLASIDLYTQIVLVPGRNDGEVLEATLDQLAARPNVLAVACVPVGLTDHRRNLPQVRPFDRAAAADVLRRVEPYRQRMLRERGTHFVFPSDELYLLAGQPLPPAEDYEDFAMLENGVGMVRDFLCPLPRLPDRVSPRRVLVATGTLFAPLLEEALKPLRAIRGLELELRPAVNRAFGSSTTVAGLLTGRCLLAAVEPGEADLLLIPPSTLRYGTELFLDGLSLDDLSTQLAMEVRPGGRSLAELAAAILGGRAAGTPQFGFSAHARKEAGGTVRL